MSDATNTIDVTATIGTKNETAETAEVIVIDAIIETRTERVETKEIRTETKKKNMKINPAAVSEEIMTVVTVEIILKIMVRQY